MISTQDTFKYKCEDCNILLTYAFTYASLDHEGKPTMIESYYCHSCNAKDNHYIGSTVISAPAKCIIKPNVLEEKE